MALPNRVRTTASERGFSVPQGTPEVLGVNPHALAARGRSECVKRVVQALGGPGLWRGIVLHGGSRDAYKQLSFAGHNVHTLLGATDEFADQRKAGIRGSPQAARSCDCTVEQWSDGCTHTTLQGGSGVVLLLIDRLMRIKPSVVEKVLRTGARVLSVQPCEYEGGSWFDITGTNECVAVEYGNVQYYWAAGNNGPYISKPMCQLYPRGARVTLQRKERVNGVEVLDLGLAAGSNRGYVNEPMERASTYDVVHADGSGFLLVKSSWVDQVLAEAGRRYAGKSPYERVSNVVSNRVGSSTYSVADVASSPHGLRIAADQVVIRCGDYSDWSGRVVQHVSSVAVMRNPWEAEIASEANYWLAYHWLGRVVSSAKRNKLSISVGAGVAVAGVVVKTQLPPLMAEELGSSVDDIAELLREAFDKLRVSQGPVEDGVPSTGLPEPDVVSMVAANRAQIFLQPLWQGMDNVQFLINMLRSMGLGFGEAFDKQRSLTRGYCLGGLSAVFGAPLLEEWNLWVSRAVFAWHLYRSGSGFLGWGNDAPITRLVSGMQIALYASGAFGCDSFVLRWLLHTVRNVLAIRNLWSRVFESYLGRFGLKDVQALLRLVLRARGRKWLAGMSVAGLLFLLLKWWRGKKRSPKHTIQSVYEEQLRAVGPLPVNETGLSGVIAGPPGQPNPRFHELVETERDRVVLTLEAPGPWLADRSAPALLPSPDGASAIVFAGPNPPVPRAVFRADAEHMTQTMYKRVLKREYRFDANVLREFHGCAEIVLAELNATSHVIGKPWPHRYVTLGDAGFEEVVHTYIEKPQFSPRIKDKWRSALKALIDGQSRGWLRYLDPIEQSRLVMKVFLKREWYFKDASDPAVARLIWNPDAVQVVIANALLYDWGKAFKVISWADDEHCYTGGRTGVEMGEKVAEFARMCNSNQQGKLTYVCGDDVANFLNPFVFTDEAALANAMTRWTGDLAALGRKVEVHLRPLAAASYCSSRFVPALDPKGHATIVLTFDPVRAFIKAFLTVSTLPVEKFTDKGDRWELTKVGVQMWLRRIYDICENYLSQAPHDPLVQRLFGAARVRVLANLSGDTSGPRPAQHAAEVADEEFRLRVGAAGYKVSPLYETATEMWYGMTWTEIDNAVTDLEVAVSKWKIDDDGNLPVMVIPEVATAMFKRALGKSVERAAGYSPASFVPGADQIRKWEGGEDFEYSYAPELLEENRSGQMKTKCLALAGARHVETWCSNAESYGVLYIGSGPGDSWKYLCRDKCKTMVRLDPDLTTNWRDDGSFARHCYSEKTYDAHGGNNTLPYRSAFRDVTLRGTLSLGPRGASITVDGADVTARVRGLFPDNQVVLIVDDSFARGAVTADWLRARVRLHSFFAENHEVVGVYKEHHNIGQYAVTDRVTWAPVFHDWECLGGSGRWVLPGMRYGTGETYVFVALNSSFALADKPVDIFARKDAALAELSRQNMPLRLQQAFGGMWGDWTLKFRLSKSGKHFNPLLDLWVIESDAEGYDMSFTPETLRLLCATRLATGVHNEFVAAFLRQMLARSKFAGKGVTGTADCILASGLAPTNDGGSFVNLVENAFAFARLCRRIGMHPPMRTTEQGVTWAATALAAGNITLG